MNVAERKARAAAPLPTGAPVVPLARAGGRGGGENRIGAIPLPAFSGKKAVEYARAWATGAYRALAPALLLLIWDVGRLSAAVAWRQGRTWRFSEEVSSRLADFAPALDEVLALLRAAGFRPPRRCYLAARFIAPARVDLPVDPEKPRRPQQMRELVRAEMEPVISETGATWTIGAVLAARGLIGPEARERIALELALRREQSNVPTYFGQMACDLGLIGKEDLQTTLRLQEQLQTLESSLACGWTGYRGEPGEPPVWLAAAAGLALWGRFEAACKRRGLKILGGMPMTWSASETAGDAASRAAGGTEEGWTDERRHSRIALEIHAEEVVAVLRHRGRIVSARVEGRMERALKVDWLLRLVADWRAGGVNTLEIVCLDPGDETAARALLDDFGRQWGQPPQWRDAAAARRALFECLAGQHKARFAPLPLIRYGELPRPPWKRVGFWHLLLPLLALAIVTGVEIRQRAEIRGTQTRMDLAELASRREASLKQRTAGVTHGAQQAKKELNELRRQLARIMPEVERLQAIENMMDNLPRLLRTLARNISDEVVLEVVRNSRSGGDVGDIMVIGWTNSYSSAQDFALRMQGALASLSYSVAQTDVRSGKGRGGRPGYFVSFWLVPRAQAEELGVGESGASAVEVEESGTSAVDGKTEESGVPEKTEENAVPETAESGE